MSEQTKRGRGRPATGRKTQHIDLTLALDILDFLATKKSQNVNFSKSEYVNQAIREKMEREQNQAERH